MEESEYNLKKEAIRLHNKSPVTLKTVLYEEIYTSDLPPSSFSMNEGIEISLVIEGCGIHKILNDATDCKKGDIFILGSGISHGYFATEDGAPKVISLCFNASEVLSGSAKDEDSEHFCMGVFRDRVPISVAMLNAKAYDETVEMIGKIAKEINEERLENDAAVKALLSLLLISLSRYIDMADTAKSEHPKEWVMVSAAMREVVKRCGDSDMTLETIASTLFTSKSHLSRIFKTVTGENFADYVRNLRLSMACNLLKDTNLTNEEIVRRSGLRDVPSFYRLFKSEIGMTPYQYRMSKQTYKGEDKMSICMEISENLQKGKAKIVKELVAKALEEGMPAAQILNEALLSGMSIVGEKFKKNEVYVPEVLVAARAMNMGVEVLKPLLKEEGMGVSGKVCLGTVQGDLHDIGKNLVKIMMEGKGLEVIDLGTDVPPETFIKTATEENCDIICLSALLTTTMDVMGKVVEAAKEAGIRDKVKIMIGGAPINQEFCEKIGADKYTSDAASAADAAIELLA